MQTVKQAYSIFKNGTLDMYKSYQIDGDTYTLLEPKNTINDFMNWLRDNSEDFDGVVDNMADNDDEDIYTPDSLSHIDKMIRIGDDTQNLDFSLDMEY